MVNVTHNNNYGRTADKLLGGVLAVVNEAFLDCYVDLFFNLTAHFHSHKSSGLIVYHIGK